MKSYTAAIVLISLALGSGQVFAGPDESMRVAQRMAAAAKQKLAAAQAAKGAERHGLMAEHMTMMKDVMGKMNGMKPKQGMNMQEHEQWIADHQALMQQMMEQMAGGHQMMTHHCRPEGH